MRALTWHGRGDIRVEQVPDPTIQEPTDAIIRITSSGICGSDLHLVDALMPFMEEGDILGHEPMGIVEEVGAQAAEHVQPGDRVVIPFNISCGSCFFCDRELYAQCETTQVEEHQKGARLYGYTHLYGGVPGAQAEYLRVPMAHFGPIKLPEGPPDDRFVYLSDVVPTAWQAVKFAAIPEGGTVAVYGLGPIGQMCVRIARHLGAERVFAIDSVPERLDRAREWGAETLDHTDFEDTPIHLRELTEGRGPDSVIDAVGMEAQGSILGKVAQAMHLPMDRTEALRQAIGTVRRGGTLSIIGVYAGLENAFPMGDLFDKGVQVRMGQCHVKRWVDEIMPLLVDDDDPLGTESFATHHLSLDEAVHGYEIFRDKKDGCQKVVLHP